MVTPLTAHGKISSTASLFARATIAALAMFVAAGAYAAPPKIRTDAQNAVPRCVTPKRLMAFLKTRNANLDPRYADIASLYKKHGETWHVRWDYAFFQMALETNFLTYRKGDGGWGDVNPKQNNFAGLGTTGGGVPGDSYPNVSTGVLAQIQHLVVYSGERIEDPVGARTKLKQDDILVTMASKRGNTTFGDLARRWAADKRYGASIEWVADSFRQNFCTGPDPVEATEAPPKPKKRVSEAKPDMVRAANLGGPLPSESATAESAGPPVRTIWSASNAPRDATASAPPAVKAATAKPQRKPAARVVEAETAPTIEKEQLFQTGSEPTLAATDLATPAPEMPAPSAEPEAPAATAAVPSASEEPAPRPAAFAYAAALGTALPKARPETKASADAATCNVASASYGGKKVFLVRSSETAPVRYTVLTVLEGFEKSMLQSYLKAHAPSGSSLGEFATKDAAFAKAKELCASAARAPQVQKANAG
jgi:hypothetical protein